MHDLRTERGIYVRPTDNNTGILRWPNGPDSCGNPPLQVDGRRVADTRRQKGGVVMILLEPHRWLALLHSNDEFLSSRLRQVSELRQPFHLLWMNIACL